MKKPVLIFMTMLFVASIAAHAQVKKQAIPKLKGPEPTPLNCKQYHNGTFKIPYLDKTIIVKRHGDIQEEYEGLDKPAIVYKVKWLSDCTYTLTPTAETVKQHKDIKKNTVLTVDIVQQNTASFTQIVSANYSNAKVNLEVYPVK